jgi:hypothetical protein
MLQRVIRSGDAHKGQTHIATTQKLTGDLIIARMTGHNLLGDKADVESTIARLAVRVVAPWPTVTSHNPYF